jgi:hypothetical protein
MNYSYYFTIGYFVILISYFVWYICYRLICLNKKKKKENKKQP